MAQILLALNFGESSALESPENSDFFRVIKNMYAQLAQNLIADSGSSPDDTKVFFRGLIDVYMYHVTKNNKMMTSGRKKQVFDIKSHRKRKSKTHL